MFYRSFAEAIRALPEDKQLEALWAVIDYGLYEKQPEEIGVAAAIYLMAKPQIDVNNQRYQNGTKGGRPKTKPEPKENQMETEQKPNDNQNITKPEPKEKVKEKENVKDKDKKNIVRFTPPTEQEVIDYCREKGYTVDAGHFIDYYSSNGWMVSKNKMKDWKAAVRNWNRNQRQGLTAKGNQFTSYPQRSYDMDSLEAELLRKTGG